MSEIDHLLKNFSLGDEVTHNQRVSTTSEPRIITFSTTSHVYDARKPNHVPPQPQVNASSQIVPTHHEHLHHANQTTDSTLLHLDTLAHTLRVSYTQDTFFFTDNKAFEDLFDCVTNPLDYPNFDRVNGRTDILKNVRHLAIGGMVLTPVILETLMCFENLRSLCLDSRIILSTDPNARARTERELGNWLRDQLRGRGSAVPVIEWIWDLAYWVNRRSRGGKPSYDRREDESRVFECDDDRPGPTSFVAQCVAKDNRRFVPRCWSMHDRQPWLPVGAVRF